MHKHEREWLCKRPNRLMTLSKCQRQETTQSIPREINFCPFSCSVFVILDPPEIVKRPANQAVRVGGVASFFCSARGDPVPSIVWRKNGKKVPGTQSRYSVTQIDGLSILRIEPVRAGRDDAPYECVAENGVGDAVSAEATLTVYEGKMIFVLVFKPGHCLQGAPNWDGKEYTIDLSFVKKCKKGK